MENKNNDLLDWNYWKRGIPFSPKKGMNQKYLPDNFCHLIIIYIHSILTI